MKNIIKKFTYKENITIRLDNFLSEKLKITRSKIAKLTKEQDIFLNNKLVKKGGLMLKAGDEIRIEEKAPEVKTETKNVKVEKTKTPKLNIIAVTDDYIVVEKPNGLLSHQTEKNEADSVASILAKKYPELKKVGDDKKRPGIVHRLDKEASGLMVVARTQKMFEHLKEQFKSRTVIKEYMALAHGKISKDADEIRFHLERSRTNDRMSALPATNRGEVNTLGKDALTEFWVEQRFINFTLVKVKIHTGRMHQIRAHFLAYDRPLVGDPLYYQKKLRSKWDKVCGRLFLHCVHLGFTDLDGQTQEFTSELPKQLSNFLLMLK